MSAPAGAQPATPARLRRVLAAVLLVCCALAVAGYFWGGYLIKHPPTKEQAQPGH
ncbi:MAG TPA: hypothetical protein VFS09_07655 [Candidatus Eisenbacteria bacterium]|nr:hypothetical protein [Candidatus Eisenbacteria bacterium]